MIKNYLMVKYNYYNKVKYNFEEFDCSQFYDYYTENKTIISWSLKSKAKYLFYYNFILYVTQ